MQWREHLDAAWSQLRFENVTVSTQGSGFEFEAQVFLAGLKPEEVVVQLYANGIDGAAPQVYDMTLQKLADSGGVAGAGRELYRAAVPANRAVGDYTARIVPRRAGAAVPLEANHILWQH
ncbi:MAG: hypothetical protein WDM77_18775 [Steroidobacteraceae bacterium]